MNKAQRYLVLASALAIAGAQTVSAAFVQVDEFGNGTIDGTPLPWFLEPDPTRIPPTWNVLVYQLPFAGVAGDVVMLDEGTTVWSDEVRFDGQGYLIFYSDSTDGYDAPADTPYLPDPPPVFIFEVGSEAHSWADYTPTADEPGFDLGFQPVYKFISDIPEPAAYPAAFGALALGVGAFLRARARKG